MLSTYGCVWLIKELCVPILLFLALRALAEVGKCQGLSLAHSQKTQSTYNKGIQSSGNVEVGRNNDVHVNDDIQLNWIQ
jgi:hypothetical protein